MVIDMRPRRLLQTRSRKQCRVQDLVLSNKRAKVYLHLMDSTGYINASAIRNPAEYFLQCNAKALMEQTTSLFFTVAFSAVPLILYIPPIRSLNLFVETIEDMWRESSIYTGRMYHRLRLNE
ncbi:Uncharacterized protein Fot_42366 [Forsythia ovata]|uniref:Uncharacterized protein n=1 Tax=Forsythia ovata TaxID=205694 RepID=A0ABD1RLY6_9LAMI